MVTYVIHKNRQTVLKTENKEAILSFVEAQNVNEFDVRTFKQSYSNMLLPETVMILFNNCSEVLTMSLFIKSYEPSLEDTVKEIFTE